MMILSHFLKRFRSHGENVMSLLFPTDPTLIVGGLMYSYTRHIVDTNDDLCSGGPTAHHHEERVSHR